MAQPLSADRLVAALREEGLRVVEHRSWRTHNRNGKGPWGPVNGVVVHHTVSSGAMSSVDLCYDGYDELPGPLCHGVIVKDGTVYLVGNGRSNHAGLGDGDVLNAVIAERPLPEPDENDTDGNARFYGFECVNLGDGKDPWPAAQLEAIEKASAAICRAHGWTERSVIGHKEWTNTKNDPLGFTMASMRSRVGARLQRKPDGPLPNPPQGQYAPFPGSDFFRAGRRSALITAMGVRLVEEGCGRYEEGPGPEWTETDRASYAAWQRKLGYSGSDADGTPGETSWTKLKVPKV
ncbi:peptidoglycan-binding protein [Streptomyces triculaminicus]|uniref:peptidoglycan-binding protein n=1 Tax=Streptomyces triculaminicus TaxID=2816232 RepID=UPI0037D98175